jgi:hypothetical protein
MSRAPLRWLAAAALAMAVAGAKAQLVIDQVYTPYINSSLRVGGSSEGRTFWLGQTFTAGLTGPLAAVDLAIWRDLDANFGLVLKVFAVSGLTLGAELGTVLIAPSEVPVGYKGLSLPFPGADPLATHVDLSAAGVAVRAGSSYTLLVSSQEPFPITTQAPGMDWYGNFWFPGAIDPYPGGQRVYFYGAALAPGDSLSSTSPIEDLGFRTYVSAVPDAPTATLAVMGLALLLVRRTRHRVVQAE